MTTTRRLTLAAALASTALLAACGGGGGGSTPTSSTSTPTTTASGGTLSTPNYSAGSVQLSALQQLNTWRQQCHFPALNENTELDQAAANHLNYMQSNAYLGHYEVAGNPGYTGATPLARAQAQGYGFAKASILVDEENGNWLHSYTGADYVAALASIPYHLAGLMLPTTDFGMDFGTVTMGPTATYNVPEIVTGFQGAQGTFSAAAPLTFPCAGVTGVDYESAQQESPAPAGIDTGTNPIGTPITVIGNMGDTIVLQSATISDTATSTSVGPVDMLDSGNDTSGELRPNMAVVFPTSPLQPNTSYMVQLVGTDNGATFSTQFTFTTGNQGQLH